MLLFKVVCFLPTFQVLAVWFVHTRWHDLHCLTSRRALDLVHTILIVDTVWESIIVNFNKPELMDLIPK